MVTLHTEDKDIAASLYMRPDNEYIVWLRVGPATYEIKRSQIPDVVDILLEMEDGMTILDEDEEEDYEGTPI